MIISEYTTRYNKPVKVSDLSNKSNCMVEVECPECKEIRKIQYRVVAKAGHYFCNACYNKIRHGKDIEIGTIFGRLTVLKPSKQTGYSVCECECGNVKEISNRSLRVGDTNSCGCLAVENMKKNSYTPYDEEHWNWKGGISPDRQIQMNRKEYKLWRKEVLDRDNYICQKCNVDTKLDGIIAIAHHINNYKENEHIRLDASNGATLCKECHDEFHRRYGKLSDNEDYKTFIKKEW